MKIISLYDRTTQMVVPWAEAGHHCSCYDIQHPIDQEGLNIDHYEGGGIVERVYADLSDENFLGYIDLENIDMIFAFPPCTHVAVSGRAHFKNKGLKKLIESLVLFDRVLDIVKLTNAPWMIENPISTVSTYWRKPDYYFHPWQYGDNYTKKTCLWVGNGFVMPTPSVVEEPPDVDKKKILFTGPRTKDSGDLRSITPVGFSRAVFEANNDG